MENSGPGINEGEQLFNALRWSQFNKNVKFARTKHQKVNTSYITSALNPFKAVRFDFTRFHHVMNEAWLQGNLDPLQNFPGDFSISYLSEFLIAENARECALEKWKQWIAMFKGQYESMGCRID
jgi:hypothetical protein